MAQLYYSKAFMKNKWSHSNNKLCFKRAGCLRETSMQSQLDPLLIPLGGYYYFHVVDEEMEL